MFYWASFSLFLVRLFAWFVSLLKSFKTGGFLNKKNFRSSILLQRLRIRGLITKLVGLTWNIKSISSLGNFLVLFFSGDNTNKQPHQKQRKRSSIKQFSWIFRKLCFWKSGKLWIHVSLEACILDLAFSNRSENLIFVFPVKNRLYDSIMIVGDQLFDH